MGGIAAIVDWSGLPNEQDLARMYSVVPHRFPGNATGRIHRAPTAATTFSWIEQSHARSQRYCDPHLITLSDSRLHQRAELHHLLQVGQGQDLDDSNSIGLAYRRFGTDCFSKIFGDFATVIWSSDQQRVIAARDPFATRPLYYAALAERLYFFSEPKQVLCLPEFSILPDELTIAEYLFNSVRTLERSFFRGVGRVLPGHALVATSSTLKQVRYWMPDLSEDNSSEQPEEYLERFNDLFSRAIQERVPRSRHRAPVVSSDLSGGRDSSALVVATADLMRHGSLPIERFIPISARFIEDGCDEGKYIDAVLQHSGLHGENYYPSAHNLSAILERDFFRTDSPRIDLQHGFFLGNNSIAKSLGASVHFLGVGGDEVIEEPYYLQDLIKGRYLKTSLREIASVRQLSSLSSKQLFAQLACGLTPEFIKSLIRNPRSRKLQEDVWANQEFLGWFNNLERPLWYPKRAYTSKTQQIRFEYTQYPLYVRNAEMIEALASHDSLEISYPFFDRRLIEFLLRVPIGKPHGRTEWKFWTRQALGAKLPRLVRERRDKTSFNSFNATILQRELLNLLPHLPEVHLWKAQTFLNCRGLKKSIEQFVKQPSHFSMLEFSSIWAAVCLESWLSSLSQYNTLKGMRARQLQAPLGLEGNAT